jgi:hypothetical protein
VAAKLRAAKARAAATARAEARQRAAALTASSARETKRLQAAAERADQAAAARATLAVTAARAVVVPKQSSSVRPLFVALLGFAVLMVLLALTPAPAALSYGPRGGHTPERAPGACGVEAGARVAATTRARGLQ